MTMMMTTTRVTMMMTTRMTMTMMMTTRMTMTMMRTTMTTYDDDDHGNNDDETGRAELEFFIPLMFPLFNWGLSIRMEQQHK